LGVPVWFSIHRLATLAENSLRSGVYAPEVETAAPLDGSLVVTIEEAPAAVKWVAKRNRILVEGASACAIAAGFPGPRCRQSGPRLSRTVTST